MSSAARVGMRPEDIGALRQVQDPKVSPDGTRVAFTMSEVDLEENRYRRRIWLAPVDGSGPARPFTAGTYDSTPRWSPDGRLLAFVTSSPDGPTEICVLPADGPGERVVVATWAEGVDELAWSPEGTRLAFVARERDPERYGKPGEERKAKDMPPRRITRLFSRLDSTGWVADRPSHVMVVPADGSSRPKVLTPGELQATEMAWSPDGTTIAFVSARHDTWDLDLIQDVWTIAADGSDEPRRVSEHEGAYATLAWSPDGSRLACLRNPSPTDDPRHERLAVLEVATGERTELALELDRNCGPYGYGPTPVWCGDDRLLFCVEDSGNLHLYAVDASGAGRAEPVVTGERWVAGWDWAAGTLALAVTTATELPELVVRDLPAGGEISVSDGRTGGERRLTSVTESLAARVRLVEPVAFGARSADGTEVPCWAMPPAGAEAGVRYPTLLNVHGGPFTSYGNRFFDEFQLEVGAGFGVIYCNPRGSSGYSEAWGRAVRWPECDHDAGSGWGGVDYEDVMACVDEACRRFDWVDPERLGILGGSYGGYMTSWAIGHTDRFRAACSERACNNLLSLEHNSDIAGVFRGYVGKSHLEAPDAFLRQSPISYVKEMTTPVLILHSEEDLRCPINQAEELFIALRMLGRNPVMVRFPGESHELSRGGAPAHRVQRAQLILEWFEEHLAAGA
ncbi:MAG TPA: S9 family peptidase [Acidimicrobiales bacterium]|nr:S9 family peptidase [Acidimicrobiales bacterium]